MICLMLAGLSGVFLGAGLMVFWKVHLFRELGEDYDRLVQECCRAYREIRRLQRKAKVAVPPPWFPDRQGP